MPAPMGGFLPRSVSLYPECAVEASALADHRTRAHLAAVEQRGPLSQRCLHLYSDTRLCKRYNACKVTVSL